MLLDDTYASTFDPAWLRQQIALIPQEPIHFTCPIADNIAYGQAATPPQIQEAAELVGLHARVKPSCPTAPALLSVAPPAMRAIWGR